MTDYIDFKHQGMEILSRGILSLVRDSAKTSLAVSITLHKGIKTS